MYTIQSNCSKNIYPEIIFSEAILGPSREIPRLVLKDVSNSQLVPETAELIKVYILEGL
jgi:hypothetical protein